MGGTLLSSLVNVISPFGMGWGGTLIGTKNRNPKEGYIIWAGLPYVGRVFGYCISEGVYLLLQIFLKTTSTRKGALWRQEGGSILPLGRVGG